jgi:hypothetical protein
MMPSVRADNHSREAKMLEELMQQGDAEMERIQRLRGYL